MKRLLTLAGLALASLIGAFAFAATPAQAATCSTTTTGSFPDNQFWYCGTTSGYKSGETGSFTRLGADARGKLSATPSAHQFYDFVSQSDYNATCGASTIPCGQTLTSAQQGITWTAGSTTWTLVLEDHQGSTSPSVILTRLINTMAHEAGHHLDKIYGPVAGATYASSNGTDFDTKLNNATYGDIVKFNALYPTTARCGSAGIFTSQIDQGSATAAAQYICSTKNTITVGSTGGPGTFVILFTDPAINPTGMTHQAGISQGYNAGDSASTIAANIAFDINNTAALTSAGFSASASAGVVTVVSASGNATTSSTSGTTGSRTFSVPSWTYGTGTALATKYSGLSTNWAILQAAWPHYFTQNDTSGRWGELYAEETAVDFSSQDTTNQSPDIYIRADGFVCTKLIVTHLTADGRLPTAAEYTSAQCN